MDCEEYKDICIAPWNIFRIQPDGECYICTSAYKKNFSSLGNIFTQGFDEIWNGETAQKIRHDIANNIYTYCKTELCAGYECSESIKKMQFKCPDSHNPGKAEYPSIVYFAFDYSCKQKCIFCRDVVKMFPEAESKEWNDVIEQKILPIIEHVKTIELNGAGEFLDSIYTKDLIKKIINLNPKIKFQVITNGINFNQQIIEELGLLDRIEAVRVSLHSTSKNTYKEIFRKDNFDTVMKNLEFIKTLKDINKIDEFWLMFVICSLNYKDMKKFIELSERLHALPAFSLANQTESNYTVNEENFAVFQPNHYLYNDFVRITKDPIFNKYPFAVPDYIKGLQYVSSSQIVKNYINYIKFKLFNKSNI